MYCDTDFLIRIPGYISIPAFEECPSNVVDVPLVVRKHKCSRGDVRREFDIPPDARCVLITFGGFDLPSTTWTADDILPEGWYGFVAGPFADQDVTGRLRKFDSGFYMPDLINACDVVLGKCGYGTCSEVVAHGVPLVYVPRTGFAEEHGLITNLMEPYGHAGML